MTTTTVPASMLAEIQGWAPGGGFVRSEYHSAGRYTFTPGELFRHPAGWAVITSVGTATSRNAAGDVLDVSPAVSWLDQHGNTGSWVLWITHVGLDVRTDTRIDPATLTPVETGDGR